MEKKLASVTNESMEPDYIGPPAVPFYSFFFGGGFPYQNRLQKKGYRYSSLSTRGPSKGFGFVGTKGRNSPCTNAIEVAGSTVFSFTRDQLVGSVLDRVLSQGCS